MMVAIVAHLFIVRAPRPSVVPPLSPEAVAILSENLAEASSAKPANELPSVTVITKELVALPADEIVPQRRAKPITSGADLLAVGTSGSAPAVDPGRPAIREAVHAAPTDEPLAAVSDNQPADAVRLDQDEPAKPEASLKLSPISASRKLLAGVPRNVTPPARERVIHTDPIVEPAQDQRSLVRSVLHQYADAFGRLDADGTKAVYPTVNYVALRRAFNQLETQHLTFEKCEMTISGRDANARCQGEASYRPRIGPRTLHTAPREWTFDLAKADDGWQIVRATVR